MNPVHLLYKPGEVVKHYLENPNIMKALLFVLLPGIISLIGLFFYGFEVSFLAEAFNFLAAILSWIIASILIALIISLFARKNVRTEFYGIASAVSLTRFLGAIAVLMFLFIPAILPSEIFDSARQFHTGQITLNESIDAISNAMNSEAFVSALPAVTAIIILVLIFALISVFVYYHIIAKKVNSNFLVHSIALICFLLLDVVFLAFIGL